MTALTFISKIENGKTTCSADIAKALRSFEGRVVSISIKEIKRKRSINQSKFYMGVVIPIVMQVLWNKGNDVDSEITHEFCKKKFLPPDGRKLVDVDNEFFEMRSSTWLNPSMFEQYLERIRVFAAEHGYQIPMPNEY